MSDAKNVIDGGFEIPRDLVLGISFPTVESVTSKTMFTWAKLEKVLKTPTNLAKLSAPCLAVQTSTKKMKVDVEQHNSMNALWADIDSGDLELEEVERRVIDAGLQAFAIYSTSSSCRFRDTKDGRELNGKRWRLIAPMSSPSGIETWKSIQGALASLVGGDSCAMRVQQILFLPNRTQVNAEDVEAGARDHYEYRLVMKGAPVDPLNLPDAIAQEITRKEKELAEKKEVARKAYEARPEQAKGLTSIIEKVNATYNVEDLLNSFGYDHNGRAYQSPNSTSGGFGLYPVENNRWVSFHECDDIGLQTDSCKCGDAFDLICFHEFAGDVKKAIKELAERLDPEGQKKRRQEWAEKQQKKLEKQVQQEGIEGFSPIKGEELPFRLGVSEVTEYQIKVLTWMNHHYGVVHGGRHLVTRLAPKDGSKSGEVIPIELPAVRTELANYGYPDVLISDDGPRMFITPLVQAWTESKRRHTYEGVTVDLTSDVLPEGRVMPQTRLLNKFYGYGFDPKAGDCELILDHIWETWAHGDEDTYEYILNWLARLVQHPQARGLIAMVVKSVVEGTGKGIIIDIFTRYFTSLHSRMLTDFGGLTDFAGWMETAVLVYLNEAVFSGDKRQQGALKALITDDTIRVRNMRENPTQSKNMTSFIVSTNEEWAVPVGTSDRRYFIIDVEDTYAGNTEYFDALGKHIEEGGQEAFIHYLLQRDISKVNITKVPKTAVSETSRFRQKIESLDAIPAIIWEMLTEKEIGYRDKYKEYRTIEWSDEPNCVDKDALLKHFQAVAAKTRYRGAVGLTKTKLTQILEKIFGDDVDTRRRFTRTESISDEGHTTHTTTPEPPIGAETSLYSEEIGTFRLRLYALPAYKNALKCFAAYLNTDVAILEKEVGFQDENE